MLLISDKGKSGVKLGKERALLASSKGEDSYLQVVIEQAASREIPTRHHL